MSPLFPTRPPRRLAYAVHMIVGMGAPFSAARSPGPDRAA